MIAGTMKGQSIKDLPPEDRPRERLLMFGAENLGDSELLAILIGSGIRGESAISMARRILRTTALENLMKMDPVEMRKILGLPMVASIRIAAAFELTRRASRREKIKLDSSRRAGEFFVSLLSGYSREVFAAVYLDAGNRIISWDILFQGGMDSSSVDPRYIFRRAILNGSVGIIIGHNHPGGNNEFSSVDIGTTKRIIEAGEILGIRVLDHILVADGEWISMADMGII